MQAQTELKISPFALLIPAGAVSLEYGVSESFGVEIDAVAGGGGGYVTGNAKYYFNPRAGLDRFHIGMFMSSGVESSPGIGFLIGSKIVSPKNVLFEFGLGGGRSFDGGGVVYWKLHVGYRLRD